MKNNWQYCPKCSCPQFTWQTECAGCKVIAECCQASEKPRFLKRLKAWWKGATKC